MKLTIHSTMMKLLNEGLEIADPQLMLSKKQIRLLNQKALLIDSFKYQQNNLVLSREPDLVNRESLPSALFDSNFSF
jgi:hypothetical protein